MEQLYDLRGQRKYLTQHERDRFLKAARSAAPPVRAFCEILAYTGCRISEALALTPDWVDSAAGVVIFESLKKRRRGVFRAVPVPTGLLETLARLQLRNARAGLADRLWSWSRTTAWRRVRAVMRAAEVDGAAATPKGLRHAFGIVAVAAAVPLTIIQKWMGHSDVSTTAIYLDASGSEERRIAFRMWHWELSLHFSPRGEAKCMRRPSGRDASRLARGGALDRTLSTASKRNEGVAALSCASIVRW